MFNSGDVVQLRSGGPLMTVTATGGGDHQECTHVIYFNSVSGSHEKLTIATACLRLASSRPQLPDDAQALRHSSTAKSSLSP